MDSESGRALEPGRTLGHYRLLERIGAGGMGEVWRARDERLERDVALKVLLPGTIADEAARKRFRHEALALSRLNHPNIATVFDFDSDAGHDFLVMEYVGGVTLGAHRSDGSLAEPEWVRLGLQLAEGLAAAHHEGIVHRDLKPANLRLTTDGRLKILDFGLAHLAHAAEDGAGSAARTLTASMTEPGALLGTLGYMAPEQLRGEKADARADLWAAGLVFYELATGRRAHADAGSAQLMYAILNSPVPAPRAVNPLVSDAFEAIVLRCLEKEPAKRYASARELAADLTRLQQGAAVEAVRARRRSRRARSLAVALPVAAVLLLVALTAFDVGGLRTRLLGGGSRIRSIAVLPLVNLSNDPEQEYFADGLTEQLINDLGQVGSLRIISRTSAMQYKDSRKGLPQIARELGVDAVVEGSVSRAGERVRVSAQLIHASRDRQLWARSYDRELRDALALQNEIASAIVAEVRATTSTVEQARLKRARTVDPAVLDAILRGRHFLSQFNGDAMRKSLESFHAAVDLDPGSAEAYAGLSQAYLFNSSMLLPASTAMPSAAAAARRALQLDPDNAEAQTSLAYVRTFYEWRWKEAEPQLRRAIEVAPSSVTAQLWLGYFFVVNGRFDEAKVAIRQACALDPLSSYAASMALWPLFEGREYEAALDAARRAVGLDPGNSNAYSVMGQALTMLGRHDEACAAFRRSRELGLGDGDPCSLVAARRGDRAAAERGIDSLLHVPDRDRIPAMAIAEHYAALGNRDEAFRWLETSVRQHGEDIIFLKVDPFLDPLRSDPRFAGIVKQVFPD